MKGLLVLLLMLSCSCGMLKRKHHRYSRIDSVAEHAVVNRLYTHSVTDSQFLQVRDDLEEVWIELYTDTLFKLDVGDVSIGGKGLLKLKSKGAAYSFLKESKGVNDVALHDEQRSERVKFSKREGVESYRKAVGLGKWGIVLLLLVCLVIFIVFRFRVARFF